MMSLPDLREKQILFVTGNDIKENQLSFRNENILLRRDGEIVNQVSTHKTIAVFVIGDCTLTSVLIRKARERGVSLFLLKDNFESYASMVSIAQGNVTLRKIQYDLNTNKELEIAKSIVHNKIQNQQSLLKERKEKFDWFADQLDAIDYVQDDSSLRGLEGTTSRMFYQTYFKPLHWHRRMPRAKTDPANVLLDIGYTFLFNLTDSMLGLFGFDTYKGVYHKLFFQRKSLSCDLMEPLRCLIDRQLLKSYNLKQINEKDFQCKDDYWMLSYDKQKKYTEIFATTLMDRKEDIFIYIRDYYYFLLTEDQNMPQFKI